MQRSLHEFIARNGARLAVRLYAGEYVEHPIQVADSTCLLINIPYYAAGLIPEYIKKSGHLGNGQTSEQPNKASV